MLSTAVRFRIEERRRVLSERLERVLAAEEAGEGSTAWLETELIRDELEFLAELQRALLLDGIRRRADAVGARR
jgi:hypothetical protein